MKFVFFSAWEAILLMDTFDMESDFKTNRYNPNRSTLKRICEQLSIEMPPEPKSDDGFSWGCIIPIVIGIIIFLIYIISE